VPHLHYPSSQSDFHLACSSGGKGEGQSRMPRSGGGARSSESPHIRDDVSIVEFVILPDIHLESIRFFNLCLYSL
jgi:hypothetical protein